MDLLRLFENTNDMLDFAAGEPIFAEGDVGDLMYVVIEGEVELSVGGQLLATARPGDLVGEMALIDSQARSATATACADSRLAPVNEQRFLFMVQQTPFFSLHVMKVLAERLRKMGVALRENS
ncbi:MAG: cyclic nucleotide-binding domain-containing protein [Pseudomonadota bacterium]